MEHRSQDEVHHQTCIPPPRRLDPPLHPAPPFYHQLDPQQQQHQTDHSLIDRREEGQPHDQVPTPDPAAAPTRSIPQQSLSPPLSPLQVAVEAAGRPVSTSTGAATSTSSTSSVKHGECLRNHAASTGGHVIDGCGEFMPGGEEGTHQAFKCAACECHRNFHRRILLLELDGEEQQQQQQHSSSSSYYNYNYYYYLHNINNSPRNTLFAPPPPPPLPSHQQPTMISLPPVASTGMMMNLGAAESSSEDLKDLQYSNLQQGQIVTILSNNEGNNLQASKKKKRFRRKFSQEQKEKMMEFAEKLGWKIQKRDEQEVQKFCSQVLGINSSSLQVFKVWMHNNKQAVMKQQQLASKCRKKELA